MQPQESVEEPGLGRSLSAGSCTSTKSWWSWPGLERLSWTTSAFLHVVHAMYWIYSINKNYVLYSPQAKVCPRSLGLQMCDPFPYDYIWTIFEYRCLWMPSYGWYSPGGDTHTKNVHIFLNTNDFVTFWWYYYVSVQWKYLGQISSGLGATNLNLKNDPVGAQKVA